MPLLEALLALGLLVTLAGLGAALAVAPEAAIVAGFWIAAAGLGFGVPTGLLYHWTLRRALLGAGRLPRRWWVHPTALHDRLPPDARPVVLGWCGVGAAGFLVAMAGCALVTLGVLRAA